MGLHFHRIKYQKSTLFFPSSGNIFVLSSW